MDGYPCTAKTLTNMRAYFAQMHPGPTIIIPEEGYHAHPYCPHCDMSILWATVWATHPQVAMCEAGESIATEGYGTDKVGAGRGGEVEGKRGTAGYGRVFLVYWNSTGGLKF